MEGTLISIIVPVYNAEKYLDACVESIIRQTYTNWELILVDDGSKDESPEICDRWSKIDSRIKVIHQSNGGASAARNTGLAAAKGDYIGFVDADDLISENMYSVLVDALRNTEKKIVSCAYVRVFPSGETRTETDTAEARNLDVTQGLKALLRGEITISVWSRLFERSVFDSIRFPEGETYEELPMIIPMLIESSGIYHTGVPLYHYFERTGSVTDQNWKKCANIILKRLDELRAQIEAHNIKKCNREFATYEAKAAYSMAISLDKHFDELDENGRMCLKKYIQIMKRRIGCVMIGRAMGIKDVILYMMIVTRTFRPVYRSLGRNS